MNIIAIKGLFHTQTKAKDSNVPIGKIPDQTILLLIEGMTGSHQFIAEIALPKTVAVVVPTAAPNLLIGSKSGLRVYERKPTFVSQTSPRRHFCCSTHPTATCRSTSRPICPRKQV